MQTSRRTTSHDDTPAPCATAGTSRRRLRFIVIQQSAGVWLVRGLEHSVEIEGRSIGVAMRAAVSFVDAHHESRVHHDLLPVATFPPAAPNYWQAYGAGTPLSLAQLGITPPADWDVSAAVAHGRP